jgi:Mlc titration factor MtfA (ptsG expression regulator)
MFGFFKRRRRGRIMAQPFPAKWEAHLRLCGFYPRLPEADREELRRKVLVFLDEKNFEGCRGLVITDEVRVVIAAHACLLLLHRDTDFYDSLVTILVYPSAFFVDHVEVDEHGLESAMRAENAGESWDQGNVIVAWDVARHGALDPRDGLNVLLHEFAHQIDAEDFRTEGAPVMETKEQRKEWARVMQAEFERLLDDVENDRETLIDDYGATNPAEFFAVCTETFFEKPHQLEKHHPELFAQFKTFFKQDPTTWTWL